MRLKARKLRGLASSLGRSPREFVARVGAIVEGRIEPLRVARPHYQAQTVDTAWPSLTAQLADGTDGAAAASAARVSAILAEPELAAVEAEIRAGAAGIGMHAPIDAAHNADLALARTCYLVARLTRPTVVVETGVGYGVSSAFLLAALERNGHGMLHSIDLPPLDAGAEALAGSLVAQRLRGRWQLHRGTSRALLPAVLARVEAVDVFLHDSDHTLRNMRFEFATVWPRLAARAVVLADDIELNAAFAELAVRGVSGQYVLQQPAKPGSLFGVVVR